MYLYSQLSPGDSGSRDARWWALHILRSQSHRPRSSVDGCAVVCSAEPTPLRLTPTTNSTGFRFSLSRRTSGEFIVERRHLGRHFALVPMASRKLFSEYSFLYCAHDISLLLLLTTGVLSDFFGKLPSINTAMPYQFGAYTLHSHPLFFYSTIRIDSKSRICSREVPVKRLETQRIWIKSNTS